MKKHKLLWGFFLILIVLFLACSTTPKRVVLITPEEAARPDTKDIDEDFPFNLRGAQCLIAGDGPQIEFLSPQMNEDIYSPFVLDVVFKADDAKTIDYDSLAIHYLKLVPIDLTDKVKPYLKENRLKVDNVEIPEGKHNLRFYISYTTGEKTKAKIRFDVKGKKEIE